MASQFNSQVLPALGAHPDDVERLRNPWAQFELEKESLANQALRE